MKLTTEFDSFEAVLEAIAPPRRKPRKLKWYRKRTKLIARRRAAVERVKAKRAVAKLASGRIVSDRLVAVIKAQIGNKGGAGGLLDKPGRWLWLLGAMGDAAWTMKGLSGLFERDYATTHKTVERMMAKGHVERFPNPNPVIPVGVGVKARERAARGEARGFQEWLYRRTSAGVQRLNESSEPSSNLVLERSVARLDTDQVSMSGPRNSA